MLKKIPVSRLTLGMFVHAVDGSWLAHSLWKQKFLLDTDEMLQRVRDCGARDCWIDTAQGADVRDAVVVSPVVVDAPIAPTSA